MSAGEPAVPWTTPMVTETVQASLLITEHDDAWTARFGRERERLTAALDLPAEQIRHIGSTAVPGLAARPVLDIMLGLSRPVAVNELLDRLAALGYHWTGVPEPRDTRMLFRSHGVARPEPPVQLYLTRMTGRFWQDGLLIRNFLRDHWEVTRQYNRLKRRLAVKYLTNAAGYQRAKAAFLEAITKRARKHHNTE